MVSYPISIALRLFSYLTWSLLTYQLGTGGAALPLPHSAAGHGLRLRRPLLAAAAPLGRRRLLLLGAEPDEVQLGRQLERVQRPLEEHGVEYLEGAAPGQRQQGEVKTRRLAGLGGNSIGVKNSPNISAKSQIEQDSSINCFKNYRVTTVVWPVSYGCCTLAQNREFVPNHHGLVTLYIASIKKGQNGPENHPKSA